MDPATPAQQVSSTTQALDWVQAASGVLGLLVALIALWLTWRSASAARLSAADAAASRRASEQLAELAVRQLQVLDEQLEHDRRERARRPVLAASLTPPVVLTNVGVDREVIDHHVLLEVVLHNGGDRDAVGARFRLSIEGADVPLERCDDRRGRNPQRVPTTETFGVRGVAGPHVTYTSTEDQVDLHAGAKDVRTYRLQLPTGEWTLVTRLRHHDDEREPTRFRLRPGLDGHPLVEAT